MLYGMYDLAVIEVAFMMEISNASAADINTLKLYGDCLKSDARIARFPSTITTKPIGLLTAKYNSDFTLDIEFLRRELRKVNDFIGACNVEFLVTFIDLDRPNADVAQDIETKVNLLIESLPEQFNNPEIEFKVLLRISAMLRELGFEKLNQLTEITNRLVEVRKLLDAFGGY